MSKFDIIETKFDFFVDDDIFDENLETCPICWEQKINKELRCKTCNKGICTDCCNKMKELEYQEIEDLDKGIGFTWKCPICRNEENKKYIFDLNNKFTTLAFAKYDYLNFIIKFYDFDRLKKLCFEVKDENARLNKILSNYSTSEENKILREENERLKQKIERIDYRERMNDKMLDEWERKYNSLSVKYDELQVCKRNVVILGKIHFNRTIAISELLDKNKKTKTVRKEDIKKILSPNEE